MKSETIYPVKVSSQGQITLPKSLRQKLRVSKGQIVYVGLGNDNSLQLETEPPIMKYRGILKPKPGQPSVTETVKEMHERQKQKTLRAFELAKHK